MMPHYIYAQEVSSDLSISAIGEIKVGKTPTNIVVNTNTDTAYVWSYLIKNTSISVINGTENKVVDIIPVRELVDLVFNPKTNKGYAASEINNTVIVINGSNNNIIKKHLNLSGSKISSLSVNPSANEVYILNSTYGKGSIDTISVIDSASDEVVDLIRIDKGYDIMAVNPTLNKIYLTNQDDKTISVVDRKTKKMSIIPTSGSLLAMLEVNPANNKVYASFHEANRILVIDSNWDTFVTTFIADNKTPNFSSAGVLAMGVDPKSDILYTANSDTDSVSVINGSTGLVSEIPVGKDPKDIAVNPITGKVYTANTDSDSVTVINASISRMKSQSSNTSVVDIPGIKVGAAPRDIVINPVTKMIYVANLASHTVSVIDGSNNKVTRDIPIIKDTLTGTPLLDISVNPVTNTLYASGEQNVSIINTSNYTKVDNIISTTTDIDVSSGTNRIYLGEEDLIRVIDGTSNKPLADIRPDDFIAEGQGYFREIGAVAFDKDLERDRIYVSTIRYLENKEQETLYIIDFDPEDKNNNNITLETAGRIPLEEEPSALAVNYNTQMAYAANQFSDSVSVIDLYFQKVIANVPVGNGPVDITIDPDTNLVYVVNQDSDNITVIDGFHNKAVTTIPVGKSPYNIAVNSDTNMIYVSNTDSNTVSVIDSSINKVLLPGNVSFNIIPSNSGQIKCNHKEYPTKQLFRIAFASQCVAEANRGFQFSSWTEDLGNNSTKTISGSMVSDAPFDVLLRTFEFNLFDKGSLLNMTKSGYFTANFKEVPPPIPQQYMIGLYTLAVTVFTGWLVPNIARWVNSILQRRHMMQFLTDIETLNKDKNGNNYLQKSEGLKNRITHAYAKGKINEQHYNLLNKKISDYENSSPHTNKT